jgi:hypothetical protein
MWSLLFSVWACAAVVTVPGAKIDVMFSDFKHEATEHEVLAFIERSAAPVAAYYGKFPVPRLRLEVEPMEHHRGGLFGREFHGNRIVLYLGESVKGSTLPGDQILTHEMFHLGFPDLNRDYAWLEEGLATWLAHLNRARAGQTTETEFWEDVRDGFSDAQPSPASGGLAEEENYRRMYWGGALFWFEIDLAVREHSAGEKSLDTITRAIWRAGGTNAHKWSLDKLRKAVDRAAGFPVFMKWYKDMGPKPMTADLEKMWKMLGIRFENKRAVLEENGLRAAVMRNSP